MGKHVSDVGLEKTEGKKELKKHAATIHCSNTLSLLQRKITNALLYHAYKELMQKDEHEITVKQLCRLIGYQGNNHAVIKEALRGLIATIIEWNVIDDNTGTENWTASSIIASVSLEGPLCYYAYSPRMKQLLHSPSMFGKIDLVIQSKFRSSYGLALYENCIRYRGLPHTKWFEMDLFKKLMGVMPGKYDIFRDFKRRVLDKSIDEVNTYSDLIIAAEYVREGRRVVKVRFTLKERAKRIRLGTLQTVNKEDQLDESLPILKTKLRDEFGLSDEQISQILMEYDHVFINEKISLIKASKPYQSHRIKNLAGYLLSAVKNNYQAPPPKTGYLIDLNKARQSVAVVELKRNVQAIRNKYAEYREAIIHTSIENLPESEQARFMQAFFAYAEPAIKTVLQLQRKKYTRATVLKSPQIKALLRQFALRELDFLTPMPLEEYVTQLPLAEQDAWHKLRSMDPEHELLWFSE